MDWLSALVLAFIASIVLFHLERMARDVRKMRVYMEKHLKEGPFEVPREHL
jgi:hypothetical protein